MGPYGEFSRVLSVILGSEITYASISKGKESASGQITLDEMLNVYRVKKLNKDTKIYGLIGNPVEHSLSPRIFNSLFDTPNDNAVYIKFMVDRLEEFLDYFRSMNIGGFSVTMPHKIGIMGYLKNEVNEKARHIGAVNTVVVNNGELIGYNTDCDGAIEALSGKTDLRGKRVVVIGAGGASRAVVCGLAESKSIVTILNRTTEKAKDIAADFGCGYGQLSDLGSIDYDILINVTSVGMGRPEESPVPANLIKEGAIVFDMVYKPLMTRLLREAESKGCTIIDGLEMLINGDLRQFKLWTGRDADGRSVKEMVLSHLENAGYQN